jgi:IS5 family transposase
VLIEPHFPNTGSRGGRPPNPLAAKLRINLLHQLYSLSDPAMEEALIEVPTIRRFVGFDPIHERVSAEITILAFRHLLEKHNHGVQIFETVKAQLSQRGMTMRQGTIVNTTLIAGSAQLHQEQGGQARPGDAPGLQRQAGALWGERPHRG